MKTSVFPMRAWQFALTLMILAGLLLPANGSVHADTTITNPLLPSTFSRPTWWHSTTDNCDSTWYNSHKTGGGNATLQTSWRGLQSCGPKPGTSGGYATPDFPASAYDKNMFQCTELVARYLEVGYGLHSVQGDGGELAAAYKTAYPDDFDQYNNDGTAVYPQEGDVLSMAVSGTSTGHTTVVIGLSVSDTPGTATITLMDQNGSANGTFTLSVVNYVIQDTAAYSNYVWIHPHQFVSNSPSASVYTTITSVASAGASSIWIAGHDRTGGANFQPTTWHWDGSSWTKYNPPSQGLYNMQYINDIAIGQSSEAWAVGYYYNNSRDVNQAFKWDGSSWTRVTTNNAGISTSLNHLNSVGMDGAGNIWAVGYYNNSGNKPLLLKWNGTTTFVDQALALPTGTTSGVLTSVSFSSSNGWAVGTFYGASTGYVYYYDGSSWSSYALSSGMNVTQVVTISADEAWGVGNYNSTFRFLHYTSANGWVADTSFTLPANSTIYSIGGDSSSDILAVGTHLVGSQMEPYFLHYDGNGWFEVSASTYSEYTDLKDVSVVSGHVYAAGNRNVSYTPRYPLVLVK